MRFDGQLAWLEESGHQIRIFEALPGSMAGITMYGC
jgi:hypothetical protein